MIYFCIPCHNEERTVGVVLWKIRQVMADLPRDYQLLVADDASTDRSYEVLEPYSRVLPLVLMRNRERRGYAATIEMLLREAVRRSDYPRRDSTVVMQADFTDDPEYAVALLKRLESGADIAVSNPKSAAHRAMSIRLALGLARRFAKHRGWPAEVTDPLHGFNAFRISCVRNALTQGNGRLLAWEGATANAALLHAALPHARRVDVVEIVSHYERLQRPSRFLLVDTIRNARRFSKGVPTAGLRSVEQLAPDSIHGDRAALKMIPTDDRRTDNGRKAERDRPPRERPAKDESAARTRGRREKKEVGHARTGRPRRATEASTGGDTRPRRRSTGTGAQNAEAGHEGGGGAAPKQKRRRGGRSRRQKKQAEHSTVAEGSSSGATSPDLAAGTDDDRIPAENDASADGSSAVDTATGASGQSTRRRRRGRRGGRRHRARRGDDGTVDAPDSGNEGTDATPANGGTGTEAKERNGN